jgi:hypothetical protein
MTVLRFAAERRHADCDVFVDDDGLCYFVDPVRAVSGADPRLLDTLPAGHESGKMVTTRFAGLGSGAGREREGQHA